jgi:hypothetical protein
MSRAIKSLKYIIILKFIFSPMLHTAGNRKLEAIITHKNGKI